MDTPLRLLQAVRQQAWITNPMINRIPDALIDAEDRYLDAKRRATSEPDMAHLLPVLEQSYRQQCMMYGLESYIIQ